jgi:hypothetical protein
MDTAILKQIVADTLRTMMGATAAEPYVRAIDEAIEAAAREDRFVREWFDAGVSQKRVSCTCMVVTGGHRAHNPHCPVHGKSAMEARDAKTVFSSDGEPTRFPCRSPPEGGRTCRTRR